MIIDLCSGLGRWESAKQDVISIDFDPKTKPSIVADIRYLPLKPDLCPDLVHASPPCKYFSRARQANKWGWNWKGIAESLELVAACFRAFDYLDAKTWTLENPIGYLSKLLHETKIEYKAYDYDKKQTVFYSNNRSLRRAMIPKDVRTNLLKLIESEKLGGSQTTP